MAYVRLARANYENVQNAKFVQKFVHTFARTVAKLRSNFRFAEPLYERFFSNMTATETATEKVPSMYSTFLQVLQTDCRSLFLLWRHETLFGAVQSRWYMYSQIINQTAQTRVNKSNHTSTISSRDEAAPIGLFRMKQTSLLNLSTMEIFLICGIYFANSVNGSLNLSLLIGNCQR